SCANRSQQRSALITAEGNKMEIAVADQALQSFRHGNKERPTLCENKIAKGRPPRKLDSYHYEVKLNSGYSQSTRKDAPPAVPMRAYDGLSPQCNEVIIK